MTPGVLLLRIFQIVLPYRRRIALVTTLLPRSAWYRAALFMARLQSELALVVPGKRPLGLPCILDSWLLELTRRGPFPIPMNVAGAENMVPERATLYCSPHRSLYDLAGSVFVKHTGKPLIALSGKNRIGNDGNALIFGSAIRAYPIPADGNALLKIRNALRRGESVFANVDEDFGKPLSDRTLRIARRSGARVVFIWTDLQQDGSLLVTFQPGSALADQDRALEEDLKFLLALQEDAMRMMERPRFGRSSVGQGLPAPRQESVSE